MKTMSRREAIKMGLSTIGGVLAISSSAKAAALVCRKTPAQTEGPFYPIDKQLDTDTDLTQVKGEVLQATGEIIYISGIVQNEKCEPLENALVEIWQACHTGRYNHKHDTNPAKLDPYFQYWGKAVTDKNGKYLFKTIIPGEYPADVDWMRPPHIHYKIQKRAYHELTTQLYFEGNKYNADDKILQALSKADQKEVIVKLNKPLTGMDPNSKYCEFNITLKKV
jgi:protocatechuate 3,4-dioxygenase beta subunit